MSFGSGDTSGTRLSRRKDELAICEKCGGSRESNQSSGAGAAQLRSMSEEQLNAEIRRCGVLFSRSQGRDTGAAERLQAAAMELYRRARLGIAGRNA